MILDYVILCLLFLSLCVVGVVGALFAADDLPRIRRAWWRLAWRVAVELYSRNILPERWMHEVGERRYRAIIDDGEAW